MDPDNFRIKLIFPITFENRYPHYRAFTNPFAPTSYIPYGMGILTAFLRQNGYCVEQEDLSVKFNWNNGFASLKFDNFDLDLLKNEKEINRFLKSGEIKGRLGLIFDSLLDSTNIEGFGLIGFSIFTHLHFAAALMLAMKIKQRNNSPIVFGGQFISLYGHLYPEAFNWIDYMITGDGRIPLLMLIDYLKDYGKPLSGVPNLIYRTNENTVTTIKTHYPLEDITIPDFDGLETKLYRSLQYMNGLVLPYQISRGCLGKCSFCSYKSINEKLELKSCNKVINELEIMREKYKSSAFHFCDNAINNSYEYLDGLCDYFIKNKLNIHWRAFAKIINLDRNILKKIKDAGGRNLLFGIESGSNRILEMMNKGFTVEQAARTLKEASEAGIKNFVTLITGYPYETQDDINKTLDFIKINKRFISHVSIFSFSIHYGSPVYFHPEEYGVTGLKSTPLRWKFFFDERDGLQWPKKCRQQASSERQVRKIVRKYIELPKNAMMTDVAGENKTPILLKEETKSICPVCYAEIYAQVTEREDGVYLIKECPIDGKFDVLIETDPLFYKQLMNKELMEYRKPPGDLAIAVTCLCNLDCNICYFPQREIGDIPFEDIKKMISQFSGRFIWLTGGEPTLRKDLNQIIEFAADSGKDAVLLTNGIRLADFNYVKQLKKSGLGWVHFSFNGFNDHVYKEISGQRLLKIKLRALKNLKKANIKTVISMMLVKGLNERELNKVFSYCIKNNSFISELRIRGVTSIGKVTQTQSLFLSDIVEIVSRAIGINKDLMIDNYLKGNWRCNSRAVTPYHLHIDFLSLLMTQAGIRKTGSPLYTKIACILKLLPKVGFKNLINMILRKLNKEQRLLQFGICLRAWPDKYRIDLEEIQKSSSMHATRADNGVLPFCYALILNEKDNIL